MRLLKLHPEDLDLFKFDADSEGEKYLFDHLPAFRRMWSEQGTTFWLRFLVTYREFFINHVCLKLQSETDSRMCIHMFLQSLEQGFINIHKCFVESQYSTAKLLMKDICIMSRNSNFIPEMMSPSSVKDPFYKKETRESFRNLFGLQQRCEKASVIKVFVIGRIYRQFYNSVCGLLKRYISESDLPKGFEDNPKFQYWMPFVAWTEGDYFPQPFEKYISKYWCDELPKMLLTPDIHNIFKRKVDHECCEISMKEISMSIGSETNNYHHTVSSRYKHCEKHVDCYQKIRHDPNCWEPYLCSGDVPCVTTCETLSRDRLHAVALSANISSEESLFWKHLEVEVYPCDKENCREVSTYSESFDTQVETYILRMPGNDESNRPSSPPWHLFPPEMVNSINQMKRVEKTKARLRDKLDKKQKMRSQNERGLHFWDDSNPYDDPEYRMMLYRRAKKKFQREMESEVICRFICDKGENADNFDNIILNGTKLMNEKRNKHLDETQNFPDFGCKPKNGRNIRSVAVGCEDGMTGAFIIAHQRGKNDATSAKNDEAASKSINYLPSVRGIISDSMPSASRMNFCISDKSHEIASKICSTIVSEMESVKPSGQRCCSNNKGDKKIFVETGLSELYSKIEFKIKNSRGKVRNKFVHTSNHKSKVEAFDNETDHGLNPNSMYRDVYGRDIVPPLSESTRETIVEQFIAKTQKDYNSENLIVKCDCQCLNSKDSNVVITKSCVSNPKRDSQNSKAESIELTQPLFSNAACISQDTFKKDICYEKSKELHAKGDHNLNADSTKVSNPECGNQGYNTEARNQVFKPEDSSEESNVKGSDGNSVSDNSNQNSNGVKKFNPVKIGQNLNAIVDDVKNNRCEVKSNPAPTQFEEKTVTGNLDLIEKGIQENGGIGYDEFMLMLETGNMLVGSNKEDKQVSAVKKDFAKIPKLKVCAYCLKKETQRKTYKKCSRCKLESVAEPRYYCSRECQVEDWKESHREEHLRTDV